MPHSSAALPRPGFGTLNKVKMTSVLELAGREKEAGDTAYHQRGQKFCLTSAPRPGINKAGEDSHPAAALVAQAPMLVTAGPEHI